MGECYSCRAVSGEERISPGPIIYAGGYWLVEHAYPSAHTGWLVIVLRRHAEALHELSDAEFDELARIQARLTRLLHQELGSEKEYLAFYAEMEHFRHVHLHMVAKTPGWPEHLLGTKSFALLKVSAAEAIPPEEIRAFCERLRARW
jgi:diadenosine tetraphosphate (Ap4A) HIT family hydrolase